MPAMLSPAISAFWRIRWGKRTFAQTAVAPALSPESDWRVFSYYSKRTCDADLGGGALKIIYTDRGPVSFIRNADDRRETCHF